MPSEEAKSLRSPSKSSEYFVTGTSISERKAAQLTVDGYGVDRIDETRGYTLDNMRILKNGNNVKKWKVYDWATRYGTTVTLKEDNTENPFKNAKLY